MDDTDQLFIFMSCERDSEVIHVQLAAAGIECVMASGETIVAAIENGKLGAAVITDEAFELFDLDALALALERQPPWSDCPFVLLTSEHSNVSAKARAVDLLGNVVKMQRPLSPGALVSGVRSALRDRARQRRAEIYLREREEADLQVRDLAATLEARVLDRTRALTEALAERTEAELRLSESNELYRYTVELSSQIPWTADATGAVSSVGRPWLDAPERPLRT